MIPCPGGSRYCRGLVNGEKQIIRQPCRRAARNTQAIRAAGSLSWCSLSAGLAKFAQEAAGAADPDAVALALEGGAVGIVGQDFSDLGAGVEAAGYSLLIR